MNHSAPRRANRSIVDSHARDQLAPAAQVGFVEDGLLMENVMARAGRRGFTGVRLVQAAHENRSLALSARLGFEVREPIACMQGEPLAADIPDRRVRPATAADLESANRICEGVHGHERSGELADAVAQGTAVVVERDDHLTGYATSFGFFGHAVGQTTDDIKALTATAAAFEGLGILVPATHHPSRVRDALLVQVCLRARVMP